MIISTIFIIMSIMVIMIILIILIIMIILIIIVIMIVMMVAMSDYDHDHQHRSAQTLESDLHALTGELGEVDRRLALLRLSLPPAYSRFENIITIIFNMALLNECSLSAQAFPFENIIMIIHNALVYLDHRDDPNDDHQ